MLVMVDFQKIVSESKQLKCLRCRMAGMDPFHKELRGGRDMMRVSTPE